MAALTTDRITPRKGPNLLVYPVATNVKIYAGAFVAINSGGYATPAADAASLKVVGVATKMADNTGGANGAINVEVETGVFDFAATSITQAMVGTKVFIVDDQTFDDAIGTNSIIAGVLMEFISTTRGRVHVDAAHNIL